MAYTNEEVIRMTEIALQKYHVTQKGGGGDNLYLSGFIEIPFEFENITEMYPNGFINLPFEFYEIEILD